MPPLPDLYRISPPFSLARGPQPTPYTVENALKIRTNCLECSSLRFRCTMLSNQDRGHRGIPVRSSRGGTTTQLIRRPCNASTAVFPTVGPCQDQEDPCRSVCRLTQHYLRPLTSINIYHEHRLPELETTCCEVTFSGPTFVFTPRASPVSSTCGLRSYMRRRPHVLFGLPCHVGSIAFASTSWCPPSRGPQNRRTESSTFLYCFLTLHNRFPAASTVSIAPWTR